MLPVREILGRANCLAQRETAITALKCEHLCVCLWVRVCIASLQLSQRAREDLRIYARGNVNLCMDFIY